VSLVLLRMRYVSSFSLTQYQVLYIPAQTLISYSWDYQTAEILTNPDVTKKQNAMKFLIHFLGDIHQPLHAEDLDRGGNDICVKWKGQTTGFPSPNTNKLSTHNHHDRFMTPSPAADGDTPECTAPPRCKNLHSVWDSAMIEELLNFIPPSREDDPHELQEKARALEWANDLFSSSVTINPPLDSSDCVPIGTQSRARKCALRWASESNDLVCDYVLKGGVESVRGKELSGEYYEGAVPIIQERITRAARRLAKTLDGLAIAAVNGDGEVDGVYDNEEEDKQVFWDEL
jgi:S1/P1 Nuclease